MPDLRLNQIIEDYTPSIHKPFHDDLPAFKAPTKTQSIANQILLEQKPLVSPEPDTNTSPPFHTRAQQVPKEVQKALNDLVPAEAAHYLGEKADAFDVQYQNDQENSKLKYDGFAGSMKYYGIKLSQQILDWTTTFITNALVLNIGAHVGVAIDPMIQAMTYDESRLKEKHHIAQSKESEFISQKIIENSQLTAEKLGKVKESRLAKIKENHELERLLGKIEINPSITYNAKQLNNLIDQNPTISETHKRLLNTFVEELDLKDDKTLPFAELQDKYADHTVGLSLMARNALITQNKLKNQTERKFFEWEKTSNGLQFSISVAAAVTWFTLNIAIWAGVGISSSALPAVGYAVLGIGCAISLIGLGVLAYRSPHQFIEVMKLTYIRKSLNWMKSYTIKNILGNNSQTIQESTLRIKQLQEQLLTVPKISNEEYGQLSEKEKAKFVYREDKEHYVDAKKYSSLETKILNEERKIERVQKRMTKVSKDAAFFTDKITQAKLKDHQRSHRMYEQAQNGNKYIDSFMEEVAVIAAMDISRHSDDKLAEDLSSLLVRQYGVAIAHKDTTLSSSELHQSIKKGIEYFVGGDSERINKINMKLRHSRKSAYRMVIHGAIHSPRIFKGTQQILKQYGLEILPLKYDTPRNRKIQTETLRRMISNHLPKDEAMVLYGELWNLVRSSHDAQ